MKTHCVYVCVVPGAGQITGQSVVTHSAGTLPLSVCLCLCLTLPSSVSLSLSLSLSLSPSLCWMHHMSSLARDHTGMTLSSQRKKEMLREARLRTLITTGCRAFKALSVTETKKGGEKRRGEERRGEERRGEEKIEMRAECSSSEQNVTRGLATDWSLSPLLSAQPFISRYYLSGTKPFSRQVRAWEKEIIHHEGWGRGPCRSPSVCDSLA